jgi:hypothetical protein
MIVLYVAEGFDDEEMDDAPWDYDIEWDEVNLFITDNRKPIYDDKVLLISPHMDDLAKLPNALLKEWPASELPKDFNHYIIKSALNVK